ncbi:TIGR03936 family radical SAM-associated protein [Thermotalea metallivorans]|uniref:DUF2344 domain-containing protein n=1 Tax=Thermotalea metallivorans TaxID=520762 RepID=A0A140L924_9FIRM|nr:TIGR03936 family radical SAM-associated protein [Thermotalea metallivorans]KXG77049.1 hypothetical protein AN619_05770 [Thermotalea metallivorans]
MYKLRIRFTKTDFMKFISHLDLLRLMERALRRADIKLVFSQGFNPHPKIAFATAVPIGLSSEGEYMDIEIEEKVDIPSFIHRLNGQLPKGIRVVACKYIDHRATALMAMIDASAYIAKCVLEHPVEEGDVKKWLAQFMAQEEILLCKTTHKKNRETKKEINIKPYIYHMDLVQYDPLYFILKMTLATGSKGNLKPEILIEKFRECTGAPILSDQVRVHRLDLYTFMDDKLVTPLEINA